MCGRSENEDMMRVIAGEARRLILVTPDGKDTRPTQDRIKETLFNIIQTEVPGCVFADLCAGSGGIGIEALSRGARKAYFAENGRQALSCISANLKTTKFEDRAVVLKQDASAALYAIREKEIGIVYVDPPYDSPLVHSLLAGLSKQPYVTENTLIIVETSLDTDFSYLPELGLEIVREKRYKSQRHLFIRRV